MAAKKWPVLEPYVMYSVGELSNVTDLSNWGNLNVQFIGKLMNEEGVYICQELQKNSTKSICTDLSLVDQIPARNSTVRVWGEIAVQERANRFIPAIRAKVSQKYKNTKVKNISNWKTKMLKILSRLCGLWIQWTYPSIGGPWTFTTSTLLTLQ